MSIIMENPIEDQIISLLKRNNKDCLSIRQISAGLPIAVLRQFGLGKSSPPADISAAFSRFLDNALRQYKKGRSYYIGLNISAEEMVMNAIRRRPGLSSKILCKNLPIPGKDVIEAINHLSEQCRIRLRLSDTHGVSLRPAPDEPSDEQPDNGRTAFKAAYDKIGKGRGFVRIHRIREELGWSEARFDYLLKQLMAEHIAELHGGDPSQLSEQQIRDSFSDDNGRLYITMTWWEKS